MHSPWKIFFKNWTIFSASVIDHFEVTLYGFMAPFIGAYFFHSKDPLVQLVSAYGILASSTLTHPLGTLIFSYMAQWRGPQVTLLITMFGLGIITTFFAFLPSYDLVGIWSPILLLILRMIQGTLAAGERSVAKLYLISGGNEKTATTANTIYHFSSMIGILMASIITTVVGKHTHATLIWWRCSFIFSGVLGLACYCVRKRKYAQGLLTFFSPFAHCYQQPLNDSKKQSSSHCMPILQSSLPSLPSLKSLWQRFSRNKKIFSGIMVVSGFSYICYALPFIVMNTLVPQVSHITLVKMLELGNYFLAFDTILVFFMGKILKKHPPEKIMIIGVLAVILPIIPIFTSFKDGSLLTICFVRSWLVFWGVMFGCPLTLWSKQIIIKNDPSEKAPYWDVGFSYALGKAIIGSSFPFIILQLYRWSKTLWAPSLYVAFIGGWACFFLFSFSYAKKTLSPLNTSTKVL